MDMNDYLKGDGGMAGSQAVQDHLLQHFKKNVEQLNFKNRAALLDHLQGLQKNEIAGVKPTSGPLPFVAPEIGGGEK